MSSTSFTTTKAISAPSASLTVTGSMELAVAGSSAEDFVRDPGVRMAIENSLAAVAGVPSSQVLVSMSLGVANPLRRLASGAVIAGSAEGRLLQMGATITTSVTVDYVITIPQDQFVADNDAVLKVQSIQNALMSTSSEAMATLIEAEILSLAANATDQAGLGISVISLSAPTLGSNPALEQDSTTTLQSGTQSSTVTSTMTPYGKVGSMSIEKLEVDSAVIALGIVLVLAPVLAGSAVFFACMRKRREHEKKGHCNHASSSKARARDSPSFDELSEDSDSEGGKVDLVDLILPIIDSLDSRHSREVERSQGDSFDCLDVTIPTFELGEQVGQHHLSGRPYGSSSPSSGRIETFCAGGPHLAACNGDLSSDSEPLMEIDRGRQLATVRSHRVPAESDWEYSM
jgi:hypothetical protein